MTGLKQMLMDEQKHLETIVKKVREQLIDTPDGGLRISVDKKHIRYYHCTDGNMDGTYIKKKDMEIAEKLAQKEYDKKIYQLARKRLSQISRFIKDYSDNEIEKCYYAEHIGRRQLIKPIEPLWEDKLKDWFETEYKGKEFKDNNKEIYTQKGERVRSKSEKILADYFTYCNVSYKYECPLYLEGFGIVYPDFTFLSKKTGQEIYWEHDGMMDNPVYAQNAIKKIEAYEKNGIFPGDRLILTFETEETLLNSEIMEVLVKKYLVE